MNNLKKTKIKKHIKNNSNKIKSIESKIHSNLTKDINRIRKTSERLMRMNILRKHQIKLMNKFLENLLRDGRITKDELRTYLPKKKDVEKELSGD